MNLTNVAGAGSCAHRTARRKTSVRGLGGRAREHDDSRVASGACAPSGRRYRPGFAFAAFAISMFFFASAFVGSTSSTFCHCWMASSYRMSW
jgi:hypothetical protein